VSPGCPDEPAVGPTRRSGAYFLVLRLAVDSGDEVGGLFKGQCRLLKDISAGQRSIDATRVPRSHQGNRQVDILLPLVTLSNFRGWDVGSLAFSERDPVPLVCLRLPAADQHAD
jgi:hypothetical protein